MNNKQDKKEKEETVNFYDVLPKNLLNKHHNPRERFHNMKAIYRGIIIGPSGCGKSNTLLNIIHSYRGTYEKIILCTKNSDEALYNYMRERLGDDLEVYEGLSNLPPLEEFKNLYGPKAQILLIFDDMVLEDSKQMKRVEEAYIRARKICGGVAVLFLSQSYFKINKIIRSNASYCIIKKVNSKKDLKLILSEYNLPYSIDELTRIYERSTASITDFLLIDTDSSPEKRVRHNYTPIEEENNL